MTNQRQKPFLIDADGYVHIRHQTKPNLTRCRRAANQMQASSDGTLQCDCGACRDLIGYDVRAEMYGTEQMP
jgi:hypothetical protein